MNIVRNKETKLSNYIRRCYQEEDDLTNKSLYQLNQIYEDYNDRINSYNELLESKGPVAFF